MERNQPSHEGIPASNRTGTAVRHLGTRLVDGAEHLCIGIGAVLLAGMVLLVFVDVVARYLRHPFMGSVEVVTLAMGTLSGFAIAQTSARRGHVALDLIVCRLSNRVQAFVSRLYSLLSAVASGLLAYAVFKLAQMWAAKSTAVGSHEFALSPFLFTLASGFVLSALFLVVETFRPPVVEQTRDVPEVEQ